MVLPLLFALGGQFLAANAGAGALMTGLAAAGGNAMGQLIQNKEINLRDAALAGIGGGISAGVGGAASGVKDAAAAAYPGMTQVAPGALQSGIGQFAPQHMMQTATQMGAGYLNNGMAGAAATMAQMSANTPKMFKDKGGGSKAEQEKLKAMWGREMSTAMAHEAGNNSRWYSGDPYDWFRSKGFAKGGIMPLAGMLGGGIAGQMYESWKDDQARKAFNAMPEWAQKSHKGFEDGGVVPSGIGLPVAAAQAGAPGREALAKDQTQELFDIAILALSGKLPPQEQQDALNVIEQALGPQQAKAFLDSVQDMLSGYADQKGGFQKEAVPGYARGGVKRAMGKPAKTFAGLPMERAGIAAHQDVNMLKNLVIQMSMGNLNASQYQSGLQTLINAFGSERATQDFVNATMAEFNANGEKQFNSDKLFSDQVDAGSKDAPYVIAGAPSDVDNVMARDSQTGEPVKLASGEAILPAAMVEAAGGGIAGAYNIVNAAAKGLPHLKPHAMEFARSAHT